MPTDGKLTDLTASAQDNNAIIAPGYGKSFEVTVVKNGIETELSCIITDRNTSCQDLSNFAEVKSGDIIDVKVRFSDGANRTNISSSVLLKL